MDLKELSEVAAKNANFSPSENSHQHSDKPQLMTNDSTAWDYEDILQKIGFRKVQWIVLLISGLITITSMAAQTSIGIIAIASQCEFLTTQADKGLMMGACVTGIVLSTYIGGYISDVIGRRGILIWCMHAITLLQFISMFVTNIWLFNFINLLVGISLGGLSGALYAYLSEFNTAKYRPIVINYSTMFVSVAAIYVPATCWLVLSANWSLHITDNFIFKPWRLIILCNLLPGFVGTLMLLPFPESPKFLLSQGDQEGAIKAIEWIARVNCGSDLNSLLNISSKLILTIEEEKNDTVKDQNENDKKHRGLFSHLVFLWKATVALFQRPYGIKFSLAVLAMCGLFFSSNGMQIWYPEIVNRLSADAKTNVSNESTVCGTLTRSFQVAVILNMNETSADINRNETLDRVLCDNTITTKTYIDNMIVGLAFFIGFAIQGTLLHPLGRRNVLSVAIAVGVLSGILLNFVSSEGAGVLVLFCLYILLPGLSISIMCGVIVDIMPTHLRSKGVSLGMTLGRFGVIIASNLIAAMLGEHCTATFAIVTASMLVCGILVQFLPI